MEKFDTVEDVLDFAISKEMAAKEFYEKFAEWAENPAMRKVFEEFAAEEQRHREILENVKSGNMVLPKEKIQDMKLADMAEAVTPHPDMNYQDALVFAMHREKQAFTLYHMLANLCEDEKMRETFEMLAQEEAKHKLQFEIEYDEVVLKED
jgi:rubrerythrin